MSASPAASTRRTRWLTTKRSKSRDTDWPGCCMRTTINHEFVAFTTDPCYIARVTSSGRVALALLVALASACTRAAPPAPAPPAPPPVAGGFARYAGAYRTAAGNTLAVNGHGDLVDLGDGSIRRLAPTGVANEFAVGAAYLVYDPRQAVIAFHLAGSRADRLIETPAGAEPVVAS